MPVKKVTREIADVICNGYSALRFYGVKYEKTRELIQSSIEEKFGVNISLESIKTYSEQNFDSRKLYWQKRTKPHNPKFPLVLDIFKGIDVELSATQVWKKCGGNYYTVCRQLNNYKKTGALNKRREDGKVFYRLNPNSPYYVVVDVSLKKEEKKWIESLEEVKFTTLGG